MVALELLVGPLLAFGEGWRMPVDRKQLPAVVARTRRIETLDSFMRDSAFVFHRMLGKGPAITFTELVIDRRLEQRRRRHEAARPRDQPAGKEKYDTAEHAK